MKKEMRISKKEAEMLHRFLTVEPKDKEECLGEDETFVRSLQFPDGKTMDIKCCGVQFEEDESNLAWTEAVLFDENGCEIACSEPSDEFLGEWILENNGETYMALVDIS